MARYLLHSILISFVFLAFACSSSTPEVVIPANVISKDSMVNILTDVQILEATIDLNIVSGTAKTDNHSSIFKKHHITRQQYDSSMLFYSSHPELLTQIYDKVIAELSKKQVELNKH